MASGNQSSAGTPNGKKDLGAKKAFNTRKPVQKGRKSLRPERPNLRGILKTPTISSGTTPRRPKPVYTPSIDDKIMAKMEEDSRKKPNEGRQDYPEGDKDLFHGLVPLDEELSLSPEKIEEYCEREPFLLTHRNSMANNPKFGIIPSRFRAKAMAYEEKMQFIEMARNEAKGETTSSKNILISLDKVTQISAMFARVSGGDQMEDEYAQAQEQCEKYTEAAKYAETIYYHQMQKTLHQVAQNMTRTEIGCYAQEMWQRNFKKNEDIDYNPRFFKHDLSEESSFLQKAAHRTALNALKWTALVINEMPMNQGMHTAGSYDIAPSP